MNGTTWILLYLQVFIILFIVIPQQNQMQMQAAKMMAKNAEFVQNIKVEE